MPYYCCDHSPCHHTAHLESELMGWMKELKRQKDLAAKLGLCTKCGNADAVQDGLCAKCNQEEKC